MKHLLFLAIISATLLVGCSDNSTDITANEIADTSIQDMTLEELRMNISNQEIQDLTPAEIQGMTFMREEEKLALDVYLIFYDQYEVNIFNNISGSEQMHTNAVLTLLDRYSIEDPVGSNAIGEFQNEDLQTLYDELIAVGSASLEDALYVGCAIEEIDILDLEEYMEGTDYKDLLLVYGHLLSGSFNHLRAYVPFWENQTGEVYVPRFMSQDQFDEIMSVGGSGGNGNGNGGNGGGGNGNGGGLGF